MHTPIGTRAEKFIHKLCALAFFPDYLFANPKYFRNGYPKELCDALVLFDEAAIIFEVKAANESTRRKAPEAIRRWVGKKHAQSLRQICGAVSALRKQIIEVVSNDRRGQVCVADTNITSYYGISIIDHPDDVSIINTDLLNVGLDDILVLTMSIAEFDKFADELSTIADFLGYLRFRREFADRIIKDDITELDILAIYKSNQQTLETMGADMVVVRPGAWNAYCKNQQKIARDEGIGYSIIVDRIADKLHESRCHPDGALDFANINNRTAPRSEAYIQILDQLARLKRYERIHIGKCIHKKSTKYTPGDRPRYFGHLTESGDSVIVFMISDDPRENRAVVLGNIVQAMMVAIQISVGIGIVLNSHRAKTSSIDCCQFEAPWQDLAESESIRALAEQAVDIKRIQINEFPEIIVKTRFNPKLYKTRKKCSR